MERKFLLIFILLAIELGTITAAGHKRKLEALNTNIQGFEVKKKRKLDKPPSSSLSAKPSITQSLAEELNKKEEGQKSDIFGCDSTYLPYAFCRHCNFMSDTLHFDCFPLWRNPIHDTDCLNENIVEILESKLNEYMKVEWMNKLLTNFSGFQHMVGGDLELYKKILIIIYSRPSLLCRIGGMVFEKLVRLPCYQKAFIIFKCTPFMQKIEDIIKSYEVFCNNFILSQGKEKQQSETVEDVRLQIRAIYYLGKLKHLYACLTMNEVDLKNFIHNNVAHDDKLKGRLELLLEEYLDLVASDFKSVQDRESGALTTDHKLSVDSLKNQLQKEVSDFILYERLIQAVVLDKYLPLEIKDILSKNVLIKLVKEYGHNKLSEFLINKFVPLFRFSNDAIIIFQLIFMLYVSEISRSNQFGQLEKKIDEEIKFYDRWVNWYKMIQKGEKIYYGIQKVNTSYTLLSIIELKTKIRQIMFLARGALISEKHDSVILCNNEMSLSNQVAKT